MRIHLLLFSLLLSVACTSVPRNAAFLAESVNTGISRMHEENAKVIRTLAEVERAFLDEQWGVMYVTIEDLYRRERSLDPEAPLSFDQRRAVAANASKAREDLLADIAIKEAKLLQESSRNRDTIIQMNDTVRRYLVSLDGAKTSKARLANLLEEVVGISIDDLQGLVLTQIGKLQGR